MDQGPLIQHPLPMHNDYALPPGQNCMDQFGGHGNPHHQSYATAGAVDPNRRDAHMSQHPQDAFPFVSNPHAHSARFVPDRGVASETSSYQSAQNFTDSGGSASISTSPSSAASSLQQYTNYPTNHYTSVPVFSSSVQLPQSFVQSSYGRTGPVLDGSAPTLLPNPALRSPLPSSGNAPDRETCSSGSTYYSRNQLSPINQGGAFAGYPETPRTGYPASMTLSPGSVGYPSHMAPSNSPCGTQANECHGFPWPDLQVLGHMTTDSAEVTPEIHARVEKGFFLARDNMAQESKWTCYRRNYFSVSCSFELHNCTNNGRLYVKHHGHPELVQAMGVRLSAVVDGSDGKEIDLVQHTAKRDAGPKEAVKITKVSPTTSAGRAESATVSPHGMYQLPLAGFHTTGVPPGPLLPLQYDKIPPPSPQSGGMASQFHFGPSAAHLHVPGQNVAHTFERIQFKQATANNGKRRASQQYFHLLVELYADVRKDGAEEGVWVKVAQRMSGKVVVRGRSPSHYQGDSGGGGAGPCGRSGSNGGGSGYTSAGANYGTLPGSGVRSSMSGYGGMAVGGAYRANHYGCNPSPDHSGSDSSNASIDDGPVEGDQSADTVMSDTEKTAVYEHEGYQYYPHSIYEAVPQQLPPLTKVESTAQYTTEPRQYAVKREYPDAIAGAQYHSGDYGRFQGVVTSRGFYPDLQPTYAS